MQHSYARRANPTAAALAAIPFEPDAIRADLKAVRMAARVANAQTLNLRGNEWRNREKDLYRQLEKASDSQIKWIAKSEANYCRAIYSQIMLEHGGAEEAARVGYAELFIYVDTMGIKVPDFQKHGFIPACNRMMCETWWRRRLRVKRAREIEAEKVRGFEVSDRKETYVSDRTLERRRAQRDHNARLLKDIKAVNQQGDEYTLHDLAALSVSNPTIRRMELMTRIAGFERFANSIGFKAGFFTLTCPSRMHSNNAGFRVGGKYIPGKPNPNYDGTTPKQAQEYLSDLWAKARAALDRRGFIYFGFRVVEPHHDATPHWHMLFFMPRKQRFQIAAILRKYALQVDGNEKGADKHRFKFEDIKTGVNPATGREYSAAGYIAKYISKAIDGYAVGEDLYGNDAQKAAERIEAWASTWGIRQFQQIGGPSVTVWR
ncbi:MAG: replication endonuclease, partial [Halothiobacillus sp.]|nr:replication endonuclease [Halothiobacillus sp.]